jgi:hypothetical protein
MSLRGCEPDARLPECTALMAESDDTRNQRERMEERDLEGARGAQRGQLQKQQRTLETRVRVGPLRDRLVEHRVARVARHELSGQGRWTGGQRSYVDDPLPSREHPSGPILGLSGKSATSRNVLRAGTGGLRCARGRRESGRHPRRAERR